MELWKETAIAAKHRRASNTDSLHPQEMAYSFYMSFQHGHINILCWFKYQATLENQVRKIDTGQRPAGPVHTHPELLLVLLGPGVRKGGSGLEAVDPQVSQTSKSTAPQAAASTELTHPDT